MTMTRAQFSKLLWEGIDARFGMTYKQYRKEWMQLFEVRKSRKAYEEQVLQYGFEAAPEKTEGAGVAYDEGGTSWTARYVNKTYALGFSITEEAVEDNLYGDLGNQYSEALAQAMYYTEEIVHADVFNYAFNTSYTGGDGKPLLSTSHPLAGGGTFANKLATPADLSETSLEAACIEIEKFTNDRGVPVKLRVKKLAIPTDLKYDAKRILGSELRSGTADNDTNALRDLNDIPDVVVNHYFTDTDAWFLITDAPRGLQHFNRVPMQHKMDGDHETGNLRFKARRRFAAGWTDPRACFGSEGG